MSAPRFGGTLEQFHWKLGSIGRGRESPRTCVHAILAAAAPIIPVSRPSFCRVPPGVRSIHPHKCHIRGNPAKNDGLETGIVGAAAKSDIYVGRRAALPDVGAHGQLQVLAPRLPCQRQQGHAHCHPQRLADPMNQRWVSALLPRPCRASKAR